MKSNKIEPKFVTNLKKMAKDITDVTKVTSDILPNQN